MFRATSVLQGPVLRFLAACVLAVAWPGTLTPARGASPDAASRTEKRWLFVWRNMSDPKEVDRMIARFPRAQAAGYNGVAFSYNIPEEKAGALKQAAQRYGLDLIAIVMGGAHERNYVEGVPSQDALFVAQAGKATFQPDNPTRVRNGEFEEAAGNHFSGWSLQDDEGVTTFADHEVVHGGRTSLRMESVGKNPHRHCRVAQPLKLQPHRQYRISVWVKSENLTPADAEVKVLTADSQRSVSFQTFRTQRTQDWTHHDLLFNSLEHKDAMLYLGSWSGKDGKLWWDDLRVEEVGLVNVLRRPGCPVTVRGENGTRYQEGRDYEKVVDPQLHPWRGYHEPPAIQLTPRSRIRDGERLRVTFYHPLTIYEDRITSCLSEPKIFADWREEVERANRLFHPTAFFMSHDELRVMNQCALCRSKRMTPGELLAWNVRKAAHIIRDIRPDAEIWVWSDMFDPMHNAVDQYYAVNGSLKGSWKGLDKKIGIVNWHGGLMGKNCAFFAGMGLRQILSGYYDSDEDGSAIARWLANTRDVPRIVGAMYTTWEDRYDAMDAWARKAWGDRRAGNLTLPSPFGGPPATRVTEAVAACQAPPAEVALFDGQSFDGWEGDTQRTWRIQDGAIVGGSLTAELPHNEFLCTTRAYENFHLRLQVRLVGTGFVNGGIQFRSRRVTDPPWEVSGYQADVGEGYWGGLYDESRRNAFLAQPDSSLVAQVVRRDDWNDYEIRCEGPRIQIWVNGLLTVDYTEPDPTIERSGVIGLQVHGGGTMEAAYRELQLLELP